MDVIDLSDGNITDEGLKDIVEQYPFIKKINLCACKKITDGGLKYIVQQYPYLEDINLSYTEGITDEGLRYLGPSIKKINLKSCYSRITNEGLKYLAQQCPFLEYINLDNCYEITEKGLEYLTNCKLLKYINLDGCQKICPPQVQFSDEGMNRISKKLPQLKHLSFRFAYHITIEGIQNIRINCNGIDIYQ